MFYSHVVMSLRKKIKFHNIIIPNISSLNLDLCEVVKIEDNNVLITDK